MYALTPPLFELLAKQLPVTNRKLAESFPAVHYGILKTLYSHCAASVDEKTSTIDLCFFSIV